MKFRDEIPDLVEIEIDTIHGRRVVQVRHNEVVSAVSYNADDTRRIGTFMSRYGGWASAIVGSTVDYHTFKQFRHALQYHSELLKRFGYQAGCDLPTDSDEEGSDEEMHR